MTGQAHAAAPPAFLELAGHPVRWGLLTALSDGDLRVNELCAGLSLPQSLVSYHLGRLRTAGIIRRRRSSADGRDSYYALDLPRCGEMLSLTGASIHRGLRLRAPVTSGAGIVLPRRCRILFACTGNSARSRIAEALVRDLGGGKVLARSGGSHPKPLHPVAERVLAERGLAVGRRDSTHLDDLAAERWDWVVTLCDRVREVCPEFPGHPAAIHWSIPDPARVDGSDDDVHAAFVAIRDELETRIGFLLAQIADTMADPP